MTVKQKAIDYAKKAVATLDAKLDIYWSHRNMAVLPKEDLQKAMELAFIAGHRAGRKRTGMTYNQYKKKYKPNYDLHKKLWPGKDK